jgi:hypothetical protein
MFRRVPGLKQVGVSSLSGLCLATFVHLETVSKGFYRHHSFAFILTWAVALLHNPGMEGFAEVVSVSRRPIVELAEGIEAGGGYAIEAKIYEPTDKHSKESFRVKIFRPIDLADKVPSVVDHGRFTFFSDRALKAGDRLEISISPE